MLHVRGYFLSGALISFDHRIRDHENKNFRWSNNSEMTQSPGSLIAISFRPIRGSRPSALDSGH